MRKKILALTLSLAFAFSLCTTSTFAENGKVSTDDQIYENHYQANLKDIDVQLYGKDEIKVSDKKSKKKSFITNDLSISSETNDTSDYSTDLKNLHKVLKNEKFKKYFSEMVKSNKTPIAIGVAEAEVLITLDENGKEISSRPMTNKEVKEENEGIATASATNGQTQTRDTLSLYTSVVDKGSGTYWVQSNAYWSGGEYSTGNEAIAITWESAFGANNNSESTISYVLDGTGDVTTSTASMQDFEAYKGVAWSIPDGYYFWGDYIYRLRGAYAGCSVTRTSGSAARHYFTSEYIHTYSSVAFTASIETDATKLTSATLTLTPTPTSWKLVSYIQGTF